MTDVTERDCAPDSALRSRQEPAGVGQRAERAGAREDTPPGAQSTAHSDAEWAVTQGEENPGGVDWAGWLDRLAVVRAVFTPPDLWSTDRPALSKVWAYARQGEWTTRTGLPRVAGCVYAVVIAVPVIACCYWLAWAVKRPSRHAAAWVLLVVLARIPPLSWLI